MIERKKTRPDRSKKNSTSHEIKVLLGFSVTTQTQNKNTKKSLLRFNSNVSSFVSFLDLCLCDFSARMKRKKHFKEEF
jgi:hypothetical protein